jgi:N-acetylmuramoyl-L-alanine amidase
MIKSFFAIFLFVTLLFANNIALEVDRLNKKIPYATQGETISILHKLENLYISAVISKDKDLIARSLKGIVRCRKLLHLDSKTYEKELYQITKNEPKITPLQRVKKVKPKPIKTTKNSLNTSRRVRSISAKDNTLILKFDKPLKRSEFIFFNQNKKHNFKTIYDLKARLNFKTPKLHTSLKNIKIAQKKNNILRVVLENDKKILSKAFIRGGNLFIKINSEKSRKSTKDKRVKPIEIVVKHNSKRAKKRSKKEIEKKVEISSKEKTTRASSSVVYASSKIIVIDPGHGGHDSGAVGYKKHQEKKAVLKVAKLLKKMLVKKGYKVYMTRDSDEFIKLKDRTHMATEYNADLFISLHANAAPKGKQLSMKGIETFFLSPARTARAKRVAAKENSATSAMDRKSKDTFLDFLNKNKIIQSNKLAIDIQSGMLKAVRAKFNGVKDGGVREAPFWVLVGAQMPAVLVELGYITNPMEGDRLYNPFYQKSIAKGIYNGINNYFAHNR